jgi:hypothetical protein
MWKSLESLIVASNLSLSLQIIMGWGLAGFFISPFILGTQEFDELGKSLTVDNNLMITFAKISPLILVYFTIIFLIWYPGDGHFMGALSHTVSNPNWWKFGIFTLIIYYLVSKTAIKPYRNVTPALLGIMAAHNVVELSYWYRLDDGCTTDYDGYVECDDSYIQNADRMMEKASALNLTYESLMAAELFIMLIYSLAAYVVISITKEKLYP